MSPPQPLVPGSLRHFGHLSVVYLLISLQSAIYFTGWYAPAQQIFSIRTESGNHQQYVPAFLHVQRWILG